MRSGFQLFSIIFLLLALTAITGCKGSRSIASKKYQARYIPAELSKSLYLGMPKADALKARPGMELTREESFRTVYLEEFTGSDISSVGYYFDTNEEGTLYEFIINYKTKARRDEVAKLLLGTPNYEDSQEWLYDSKEGFDIQAWTFQNKLVIVGKIAGTEWED